jgi:sugar phosphate isomerase/epimerase
MNLLRFPLPASRYPLPTRRDFLERAVGTSALAVFAPSRLAARQARMFVSLNGALTPKVSGADKVRLAAKLGFGGVDWDLGPAKTAGLDATKALFEELKIKPTIANLPMARPLPFGGDAPAFQEGLKALVDDAAFISAVGCKKMMVVLPATAPVSKDEYRKTVVERMAAVSEVLRKANLRLGMEFLGPLYMREGPARDGQPRTPFIWTLPETVALAKDCGPNMGAVLDVWHWHHSRGTVADILAAGDRIVHVHISDAKPAPPEDVRDNQRFMPGEGSIDLVAFLQALHKAGYADGVSPEPLGRIPPEISAEEGAKLGLDTTLAVMKKAGVA